VDSLLRRGDQDNGMVLRPGNVLTQPRTQTHTLQYYAVRHGAGPGPPERTLAARLAVAVRFNRLVVAFKTVDSRRAGQLTLTSPDLLAGRLRLRRRSANATLMTFPADGLTTKPRILHCFQRGRTTPT